MSRSKVVAWLIFATLSIIYLAGCSSNQTTTKITDPVQRGAELYNANCLVCHGGPTGGTMMDMPPKHNANGHTWHHSDCQLVDIILNGSGEMGDIMRQMMGNPSVTPMPVWKDKLTRDDVNAILSYVKTWWMPEQRNFQAQVTRSQCPIS